MFQQQKFIYHVAHRLKGLLKGNAKGFIVICYEHWNVFCLCPLLIIAMLVSPAACVTLSVQVSVFFQGTQQVYTFPEGERYF